MKWEDGDIWTYWEEGGTIVIPTNIGWKQDGRNVMGRGLAKEAADCLEGEFDLPLFYGKCCQLEVYRIYLPNYDMILAPSKPLTIEKPHLSWKNKASWGVIGGSLQWLQDHVHVFKPPIAVPLIGAGNGGLDVDGVAHVMEKYLRDGRFIGVRRASNGEE